MGQQWICGELLHLGRRREQAIQGRELRYANDPAPEDCLHDDPFALLTVGADTLPVRRGAS
jgi:hypothetical protein